MRCVYTGQYTVLQLDEVTEQTLKSPLTNTLWPTTIDASRDQSPLPHRICKGAGTTNRKRTFPYLGGDEGCAERRTTKYLRVYPIPDEPIMAIVTIKGAHDMF